MIIAVFQVAFDLVGRGFPVGAGDWILPTPSAASPPLALASPVLQPPRWSPWVQTGTQRARFLEPTSACDAPLPVALPLRPTVWDKGQTCHKGSSVPQSGHTSLLPQVNGNGGGSYRCLGHTHSQSWPTEHHLSPCTPQEHRDQDHSFISPPREA